MAIYSLNLRSIGRSTQKAPYTAAAALRYIGRRTACTEVIGENAPTCSVGDTRAAEAWLRRQEDGDRQNARVVDRLIIALPVEFDHAQQLAVVREFMQRLGNGRISWIAGLHNGPKDPRNPHAHVLVRDRDIVTSRRVVGLSDKGAANRVRQLWAAVCNEHLEEAAVKARIDHRNNKARGIERVAGVRTGQAVTHMAEKPKGENRMTINHRIAEANAAMASAKIMEEDARDMALAIADELANERAARLAAEERAATERKRRMAAEAAAKAAIDDLRQRLMQMQEGMGHLIEEARDFVRALFTRVPPTQTRPAWLGEGAWQVFLTILRFGPPRPTTGGGMERGPGGLPPVKRRDQH